MLWCGQHNWLCYHCNVGTVLTSQNIYFHTGLPVGFPDLLIITDHNICIFCETKIHPRKPTADQVRFINNLRSRGFEAFVAYNLDEFVEKVKIYL